MGRKINNQSSDGRIKLGDIGILRFTAGTLWSLEYHGEVDCHMWAMTAGKDDYSELTHQSWPCYILATPPIRPYSFLD